MMRAFDKLTELTELTELRRAGQTRFTRESSLALDEKVVATRSAHRLRGTGRQKSRAAGEGKTVASPCVCEFQTLAEEGLDLTRTGDAAGEDERRRGGRLGLAQIAIRVSRETHKNSAGVLLKSITTICYHS